MKFRICVITMLALAGISVCSSAYSDEVGGVKHTGPSTQACIPYTSSDGSMKLFLPSSWKTSEKDLGCGRHLLVCDPQGQAEIEVLCLYERPHGVQDSVALSMSMLRGAAQSNPNLKLLCAYSTRERQRTVTETLFSYHQGLWKGRTYYSMTGNGESLVLGFRTPADRFNKMQPMLLSILSNFRLAQEPATYKHELSSSRPVSFQTTQLAAADGSCTMQVPAGWKFESRQGTTTCTNMDGSSGFAFFVVNLIGPSHIPHFNSSIVPGIHLTYRRPLDALVGFLSTTGSSSNHEILDRVSCTDRAQAASLKLGRACQWESGLVHYTSKHGVNCLALADVLGMAPLLSGQWGINTMVVWCPRSQFAATYPEMLRIASSFSINEQFSGSYIRAGLENLQRLMRETTAHNSRIASEILEDQRQWNNELSQRREYSWHQLDQYVRGEQSFVRDTSGQVFTTDSSGLSVSQGNGMETRIAEGKPYDYPNFEGQKWGLTPVNYEIWKQLQR